MSLLRRSWLRLLITGLVSAWAGLAVALGPHEILLLANGGERDSVAVARHYAKLRGVPEPNLIILNLPSWKPGQHPVMTPEDFTRLIWAPAIRSARARGIDDHILAWVYSTHFPTRIESQPAVSLQGLTFARNRMPIGNEIAKGTYASPLFAGPDRPGGNIYGPQTLDSSKRLLRDEMPLPAMALGYTGERGNTKAEVIACLERGLKSDSTEPTGTVYFVTNDNVRSKCRAWQFPKAAIGLKRAGVNAVITDQFPSGKKDVLGVMTGSAVVRPDVIGDYVPGCMAEHLTSHAANFEHGGQTKISRWIAAGATASAGTVWEPLSYWQKFPNARFFSHYAAGCTMIESFYQSIRCPLQLMMVGDPLAAPWAPAAEIRVDGIKDGEVVDAPVELSAIVESGPGVTFTRFVYLVDGKIRGRERTFTLDPTPWAPGEHELRVVASAVGFVRNQIFDVVMFKTK